ncbi:hypothetical protein [Anaeromyxobacter oryzisoli]|uniref:hypothetical protein n=1 Tax=Anaeromyxobacter oryzisoli TaxID=2925408 RepID=UPI001F55EA93|nr:hypothetical protein [Anaeromyxobacter sp. SG63]
MTATLAWASTVGVLVVVLAAGIVLVPLAGGVPPDWLLGFVSVSPLVASLVASFIAPKRKVLLGTVMVVPATLAVLAVNTLYQVLGRPVDFVGPSGARILAGITVAWNLPACFVMALVGAGLAKWWTSRSRAHASERS